MTIVRQKMLDDTLVRVFVTRCGSRLDATATADIVEGPACVRSTAPSRASPPPQVSPPGSLSWPNLSTAGPR